MLILGLDPGSRHTGYGLIEKQGERLRALTQGRISCPSRTEVAARLHHLASGVERLVEEWQPDAAVLEALFHGLNSRSLIVLAQARGALLAALARSGIRVREYTPAQVKIAVTGNGRADKQQVARMVRLLLALDDRRISRDASDALAVAICYAHRHAMDRLQEIDGREEAVIRPGEGV